MTLVQLDWKSLSLRSWICFSDLSQTQKSANLQIRSMCGCDGESLYEHPLTILQAPSSTLQLPGKPFAWRTASPSDKLECDGLNNCFYSNLFCDWWKSDRLGEIEMDRKEIHWPWSRIRHKMLVLVFACLHGQPSASSHLPLISTSHTPWSSQHKPWGSHPHHQELHPIQYEGSHPGYQTNIVIDPYAKVSIKLRDNSGPFEIPFSNSDRT